jgi:MYXO-CTERM domain-containing protein
MRCTKLLVWATVAFAATTAHAETTGFDTSNPSTPPAIGIVSPENGATVPTALAVEVAVEQGDWQIEAVNLQIDGIEIPQSCASAGTCVFEIELSEGEHVLTASTYDFENYAEHAIVVTAAADAPPPTPGPGPGPGEDEETTGGPDEDAEPTTGAPADDEARNDFADRGCGCTSDPSGPVAPLGAGLGLLGLVGLRRRR